MRGRNIRWPLMKMGAKHEPFNKQREGGREGAETGSDNQTKDNYPLRKGMRRRVHTKITIARSQSHFASLFEYVKCHLENSVSALSSPQIWSQSRPRSVNGVGQRSSVPFVLEKVCRDEFAPCQGKAVEDEEGLKTNNGQRGKHYSVFSLPRFFPRGKNRNQGAWRRVQRQQ